MKVYIIIENDPCNNTSCNCNVFSNKEEAVERCEEMRKLYPYFEYKIETWQIKEA